MDTLTPKQERFVQGLLMGKSQRKAYEDAGYSTKRKSQNSVDRDAYTLFHNPKIFDRYSDLNSAAAEMATVTRADVLRELKRIGFADTTDYISTDGRRVFTTPTGDIPPEKRTAIAGIKETPHGGVEIKFHDKVKALCRLLDELEDTDASGADDGFIDALKGEAEDIWQDD